LSEYVETNSQRKIEENEKGHIRRKKREIRQTNEEYASYLESSIIAKDFFFFYIKHAPGA
jgi:hypothetical protein